MSTLFGALGVNENDRTYLRTLDQSIVYEAVNQVLAEFNAQLQAARSIFVEETTSDLQRRYKLPGGGYMQGRNAQGRPGALKAKGEWDVAFPLFDYSDAIADNDVDLAYMTVQEFDRHMKTIMNRSLNTERRAILQSVFNNADLSHIDQTGRGTLTVKPLANGDAVLYPPVIGSEDEATENHYIETNYAVADISATNDPTATVQDELEEHFGTPNGGSDIVLFTTAAAAKKIKAIDGFVEVTDNNVRPGDDTATVNGLPAGMPGRVHGSLNNVWVVEWRALPANYGFGIHLNAPKPLIRRVDPAEVGLGDGSLQLVVTDERFPMEQSTFRQRYGYGVGNRLNGVVIEFGTGGSFTVPTSLAY
jgi:hypothetical protein